MVPGIAFVWIAGILRKMPRNRKLKFWNGRIFLGINGRRNQVYANICAYSQKDAIALLEEQGEHTSLYELREWWSDCWGNSMKDVVPKRGLWVELEDGVPTEVVNGLSSIEG